nr:EAL domain-containing protein [Acidovorax sp. D4N7]
MYARRLCYLLLFRRPVSTMPLRMGWRGMRLACVGAALLVLGLVWWLAWQSVAAERAQLEISTRQQQASLAAVVAENLAQVVNKGQLMALAAGDTLASHARGQQTAAEVHRRLSTMLVAEQSFARYLLLDASLAPMDSSYALARGELAPLVAALRQALRAPVAGQAARLLPAAQASAPGSPDLWQIPLAYALRPTESGATSAAGGYLLLMLDLGYFLNLYRDVEMGAGSAIHLFDTQGGPLAELGAQGLTLPFSRSQAAPVTLMEGSRGAAVAALQPGAAPSQFSWRRSAQSPFIVVASRGQEWVDGPHREGSRKVWTLLGVLSVCMLLAVGGMLRVLRHQEGLFVALSVANRDKHALIDQLEREKTKALELAANDHLTGLHNRRMFNELVASHLALARRSRKFYALMYLDLDRFKAINDSLGHHVGDLLLQAVAGRLRQLLRRSDIIARMGGDEFAVLVTGMDAMADMDALAAKLIESLSQPYEGLEGHTLQVTPSMGVAFFPRDGHDVTLLCRNADAAMYASKRAGRGRFSYYDATASADSARGYALERELPRAVAEQQLVLHFQPKVRLNDCRIMGFEALVRWQHPEYGLIHPGEFIASAEATGAIRALGDWVLKACCRQVAAWRALGLDTVPIAFNVSPVQLRDGAFAERLAAHIADHGIAPSDLMMEITESCLIEPRALALSVLEQVRDMGVSIGLDDFGTGFSSLSQIKDLPIDTLKLDRSFVNDIRSSSEAGVIVTSVITLAHNLKMRVVAEGVELMDQLVYLKTAGCDEAQGYFLSRPVGAHAAEEMLRAAYLHPA